LEQQGASGGIWHFDTSSNGPSSVYRSTVINTSKEMSAFSDFPVPEAAPTYMHHQYMLRYIQTYRRHFGLDAYTRYHTRVVDVRQVRRDSLTDEERNALPDALPSGTSPHSHELVWRVESEPVNESQDAGTNAADGSVARDSSSSVVVGRSRVPVRRVEHFHGLMVCTGHHSTPHQVRFPNQEAFQGRILHSHDYKDERPFLGQRVCVVGVGNSGVDIAVELSRHCSHTVLSTRSGVWIFPRLGLGGRPLDHVLVTRWMQYAVPAWIKGWLLETLCRLLSGDMSEVGLTPLHRLLSAHQTTNAELVPRIRTGMLRVHRDIVRFTPEGAVFADQPEVEEKLDAVVLATGYDIALPFLRSEPHLLHAVLQDDNRWTAYKFVFPLDSQYHSAAFIGFMQPQGQPTRTRTRTRLGRRRAQRGVCFQFLISLSACCFVCSACQARRIRSSRCSLAGTCPY
jgi:dimethylaniline monooxygenase (N-oxide forming)